MTRPLGTRNAQFEDRRQALLLKAGARLAVQNTEPPSFRELALACGVSVATLRHYFGNRETLIKELFALHLDTGRRHLQNAERPPAARESIESSLREVLERIARGWTSGFLGSLHRIGLSEGLRHSATAPRLSRRRARAHVAGVGETATSEHRARFDYRVRHTPCRTRARLTLATRSAPSTRSWRDALSTTIRAELDRRAGQYVRARLSQRRRWRLTQDVSRGEPAGYSHECRATQGADQPNFGAEFIGHLQNLLREKKSCDGSTRRRQ